jgi:hypothetical protein
MNPARVAIAGLLADSTPRNTGPDFGKASPVGLLIVVLLLIGTILLVWSMNRHLRKLPDSFDRNNPGSDQAADDGTVDVETGERSDPDKTENRGQSNEPGG